MTPEQKQVQNWMVTFIQNCPGRPTIPSLEDRKLRARLIFEEALETIEALGFRPVDLRPANNSDKRMYPDGAYAFVEHGMEPSLKLILDGCEDSKVVIEGTLAACGLLAPCSCKDPTCLATIEDPYFNEVMRSNFSKMWTRAEVEAVIGKGDSFDPTGIVATNVYEDSKGTRYYDRSEFVEDKERCFVVKDKHGKVIKSPSYSPAQLPEFASNPADPVLTPPTPSSSPASPDAR